jgi:ligand-binding sensor domain-containing protein
MDKRRWLILYCLAFLLCYIVNSSAFSNFTNYQSVIRVNDVVILKNKIWAASSGGLFCVDLSNNSQAFYSDGDCFPDLNLTALTQDSQGNLWIGTKRGYLYKRSSDGSCSVYDSYIGSGWDITDIYSYKDFIFVGSSKGLSLFDQKKGVAVRNTAATDTTGDPMIYAIAVHNDSLYVGGNKGFNSVNIAGSRLLNNTYNDISIWTSTLTEKPIVSFVDSSGKFLPCLAPAVFVQGAGFFHCDSATIFADTDSAATIASEITSIVADENQNLWFGTKQDFFCRRVARRDLQALVQYRIPGPSFNTIIRIHAAKNGSVWLLPTVSDQKWWEGIATLNGKQWQLFNQFTAPDIGTFTGGGNDVHGFCEDRDGNIWIGTPGSNVKFYDVQNNRWSQYYIAGYECDSIRHSPGSWGEQDAIAQDSLGYMWFSNNDPQDYIKSGPLVCYDPNNRHSPNYRRFFPKGTDHFATNIISICVDASGKILAATKDFRFLVVRHNGNPITDGVTVELDKSDVNAVDICSTPGGVSWIASGKGLFKYKSDDGSFVLNSTIPAVTCVEAENENILWLGTSASGLIRYDIIKDSTTTLDMSKGLVSNSIKDLSIDKKTGYLWVGTTEGVSRYYIGHSDAPIVGSASIIAYPNPFSLSNPNHRRIVFKHCPPDARVLIYAVNGVLVKQLSLKENSFNSLTENPYESTLFWVPSKKMAPGMYYFVGYAQKPITTKKLLIVP